MSIKKNLVAFSAVCTRAQHYQLDMKCSVENAL